MSANPKPIAEEHHQVVAREQGLARQLSQGQLGMIAIGGAIGTGSFWVARLPYVQRARE